MKDRGRCFQKLVCEKGESEYHLAEADAYREIAQATRGILPEFSEKAMRIVEEEEWLADKLSRWDSKIKYL